VFTELDRVQVKGKTMGKKIFWPVPREQMDEQLRHDIDQFSEGLHLYYQGDWPAAVPHFQNSSLSIAEVFGERIAGKEAPSDWNGVWTMTEK
jgi:hypothetical protein